MSDESPLVVLDQLISQARLQASKEIAENNAERTRLEKAGPPVRQSGLETAMAQSRYREQVAKLRKMEDTITNRVMVILDVKANKPALVAALRYVEKKHNVLEKELLAPSLAERAATALAAVRKKFDPLAAPEQAHPQPIEVPTGGAFGRDVRVPLMRRLEEARTAIEAFPYDWNLLHATGELRAIAAEIDRQILILRPAQAVVASSCSHLRQYVEACRR